MAISVFWIVMLCNLVGGYQCFEGTYSLNLQGILIVVQGLEHFFLVVTI
jgi:hypothetical protein